MILTKKQINGKTSRSCAIDLAKGKRIGFRNIRFLCLMQVPAYGVMST